MSRYPARSKRTIELGGRPLEYTLIRSTRRKKTLGIEVSVGGVEVTSPTRATVRSIEEVLQRKSDWVLRKLREAAQRPRPIQFTSGETVPMFGKKVLLEVQETGPARALPEYDGERVRIHLGENLDADARRSRGITAISELYKVEAKKYLDASVSRWLVEMGRAEVPRLLVRTQRSRWGSCSAAGVLRFSWRLAMVSPDLVDFVVVHELAHLEVMNHSPEFWEVLLRAMPDARERHKRLNAAGADLPF